MLENCKILNKYRRKAVFVNDSVNGKYSKDWCKGFCRTCGTGCGQYCEEIHRYQEQAKELERQIEGLFEARRDTAKQHQEDAWLWQIERGQLQELVAQWQKTWDEFTPRNAARNEELLRLQEQVKSDNLLLRAAQDRARIAEQNHEKARDELHELKHGSGLSTVELAGENLVLRQKIVELRAASCTRERYRQICAKNKRMYHQMQAMKGELRGGVQAVMDLVFALRAIKGKPTLRDLVKLAKRMKKSMQAAGTG